MKWYYNGSAIWNGMCFKNDYLTDWILVILNRLLT